MLHKFASTLFLFLGSGDIRKLTERLKDHLKNNFYCNHGDTFLGITKPLRDKWV